MLPLLGLSLANATSLQANSTRVTLVAVFTPPGAGSRNATLRNATLPGTALLVVPGYSAMSDRKQAKVRDVASTIVGAMGVVITQVVPHPTHYRLMWQPSWAEFDRGAAAIARWSNASGGRPGVPELVEHRHSHGPARGEQKLSWTFVIPDVT